MQRWSGLPLAGLVGVCCHPIVGGRGREGRRDTGREEEVELKEGGRKEGRKEGGRWEGGRKRRKSEMDRREWACMQSKEGGQKKTK